MEPLVVSGLFPGLVITGAPKTLYEGISFVVAPESKSVKPVGGVTLSNDWYAKRGVEDPEEQFQNAIPFGGKKGNATNLTIPESVLFKLHEVVVNSGNPNATRVKAALINRKQLTANNNLYQTARPLVAHMEQLKNDSSEASKTWRFKNQNNWVVAPIASSKLPIEVKSATITDSKGFVWDLLRADNGSPADPQSQVVEVGEVALMKSVVVQENFKYRRLPILVTNCASGDLYVRRKTVSPFMSPKILVLQMKLLLKYEVEKTLWVVDGVWDAWAPALRRTILMAILGGGLGMVCLNLAQFMLNRYSTSNLGRIFSLYMMVLLAQSATWFPSNAAIEKILEWAEDVRSNPLLQQNMEDRKVRTGVYPNFRIPEGKAVATALKTAIRASEDTELECYLVSLMREVKVTPMTTLSLPNRTVERRKIRNLWVGDFLLPTVLSTARLFGSTQLAFISHLNATKPRILGDQRLPKRKIASPLIPRFSETRVTLDMLMYAGCQLAQITPFREGTPVNFNCSLKSGTADKQAILTFKPSLWDVAGFTWRQMQEIASKSLFKQLSNRFEDDLEEGVFIRTAFGQFNPFYRYQKLGIVSSEQYKEMFADGDPTTAEKLTFKSRKAELYYFILFPNGKRQGPVIPLSQLELVTDESEIVTEAAWSDLKAQWQVLRPSARMLLLGQYLVPYVKRFDFVPKGVQVDEDSLAGYQFFQAINRCYAPGVLVEQRLGQFSVNVAQQWTWWRIMTELRSMEVAPFHEDEKEKRNVILRLRHWPDILDRIEDTKYLVPETRIEQLHNQFQQSDQIKTRQNVFVSASDNMAFLASLRLLCSQRAWIKGTDRVLIVCHHSQIVAMQRLVQQVIPKDVLYVMQRKRKNEQKIPKARAKKGKDVEDDGEIEDEQREAEEDFVDEDGDTGEATTQLIDMDTVTYPRKHWFVSPTELAAIRKAQFVLLDTITMLKFQTAVEFEMFNTAVVIGLHCDRMRTASTYYKRFLAAAKRSYITILSGTSARLLPFDILSMSAPLPLSEETKNLQAFSLPKWKPSVKDISIRITPTDEDDYKDIYLHQMDFVRLFQDLRSDEYNNLIAPVTLAVAVQKAKRIWKKRDTNVCLVVHDSYRPILVKSLQMTATNNKEKQSKMPFKSLEMFEQYKGGPEKFIVITSPQELSGYVRNPEASVWLHLVIHGDTIPFPVTEALFPTTMADAKVTCRVDLVVDTNRLHALEPDIAKTLHLLYETNTKYKVRIEPLAEEREKEKAKAKRDKERAKKRREQGE